MKTYLVAYDLHFPNQNYTPLINAIGDFRNPLKVLESTWLIQSDLPAISIANHLNQFLDSNDGIFVAEIGGNTAWGVSSESLSEQIAELLSL